MKILYIGYGALGRMIVEDIRKSGVGEIVGIVDPAVGDALPHLTAVNDWTQIDIAVVTTSSDLSACASTLLELLERGLPVVSTCEELAWPWLRHGKLARKLDEVARKNGGRLVGTGVNPGFLMDAFPLLASRVARRVDRVTVHRIQDATTRRLPFRQKIGAGLAEDAFAAKVASGALRHVGLGESLHFLAHYMDLPIDDWEETIEPVRDINGQIKGVRQIARGMRGDDCPLELLFQAAVGQDDPHDRVAIHGDPDLEVSWRGGVHGDIATSSMVISTMAPLCAAQPGLHTMATLPLTGRQSPSN